MNDAIDHGDIVLADTADDAAARQLAWRKVNRRPLAYSHGSDPLETELARYMEFVPDASERGVIDFLLTAAAIGILYKKNACISGAELGCRLRFPGCSFAARERFSAQYVQTARRQHRTIWPLKNPI